MWLWVTKSYLILIIRLGKWLQVVQEYRHVHQHNAPLLDSSPRDSHHVTAILQNKPLPLALTIGLVNCAVLDARGSIFRTTSNFFGYYLSLFPFLAIRSCESKQKCSSGVIHRNRNTTIVR